MCKENWLLVSYLGLNSVILIFCVQEKLNVSLIRLNCVIHNQQVALSFA